jgi:MraZ protein
MKFNFLGEVCSSIDDKDRIVIPSKFRDLFDEGTFITKGCEGCISIYPSDSWNEYVSSLLASTKDSISGRQIRRAIASKSTPYECDKSGRVKLPRNLLELAGITKQCMVVGAFDHLEIWELEAWKKYDEVANDIFEDELDKVMGNGGMM